MAILLYLLSGITLIQVILGLVDAIRGARYIRTYGNKIGQPDTTALSLGPVAVFCPCKGVDHDFKTNVRAILGQDFPAFDVYFIVESSTDPAYSALQEIGARNILIAGEAQDCGQKVHNLRYGILRAGREAETYVFCDSDARYPANWLANLSSALAIEPSAVVTGYRWYVADSLDLPMLLRSAWNSTSLGVLGDHTRNFAWGGSTAIRRETFDRIDVLAAWQGAVSDDYAITRAARAAGVKIRFVPSCLVPSHGRCNWRELLEFTTRQMIITRIYQPGLWATGLAMQTMFNVTFWSLVSTAVFRQAAVPALLWAIIFALSAARSALRVSAVKSRLPDRGLLTYAWFYAVASPVVALLYEYNMLAAVLTNEIDWRQIHYTLISPNETGVSRREMVGWRNSLENQRRSKFRIDS